MKVIIVLAFVCLVLVLIGVWILNYIKWALSGREPRHKRKKRHHRLQKKQKKKRYESSSSEDESSFESDEDSYE